MDRARLDRVFGDTEPATTADERGPDGSGSGSFDGGGFDDRWWRDQRPPHHD